MAQWHPLLDVPGRYSRRSSLRLGTGDRRWSGIAARMAKAAGADGPNPKLSAPTSTGDAYGSFSVVCPPIEDADEETDRQRAQSARALANLKGEGRPAKKRNEHE